MSAPIAPAIHLPGPQVLPGGVRFAVWAPKVARVEVQLEGRDGPTFSPLGRAADGWHAGVVPGAGAGARYRFRLDGGGAFPDPASRFQPEGVHGPSEVIDPSTFRWTDDAWPGLSRDDLIIYELHVGTSTPEGTFAALAAQLPELRRLGVTAIELMPVAAFPGRWSWGYDGVGLYAPSNTYGRPDDLRRLVDAAHRLGLGVILDVVYNHLGPDGNYLRAFSDGYFTARHRTPWGEAINYDGPDSRPVRDFVIGNALHWLADYHVDGFRLDATHTIIDDGPTHLLAELAERTRGATERGIVLIAEDERNDVQLVRPSTRGGYGLDAVWADDFHHELRVRLTGEREGYFADFAGTTRGIAKALGEGFLYQGEPAPHLGRSRGTPVTDEPGSAFVFCIQNHDQVGNRACGERLNHLVDAGSYAVASALLLLAPETPLLWMGQEFAASTPFLYFTDHHEELGALVSAGRREEFKGFAAFLDEDACAQIPDPQDEATFRRSVLDLDERRRHAPVYRLYRELIRLRRGDPVLRRPDRTRLRAAGLSADVVALHHWRETEHRLLVANFGPAADVDLTPDGPLGELPDAAWRVRFSTAHRRFGGSGERSRVRQGADGAIRVHVPAGAAVLVAASAVAEPSGSERGAKPPRPSSGADARRAG